MARHVLTNHPDKVEEWIRGKKVTVGNAILWGVKYPEVERWLSHLQKRDENAYRLWRFCQWAKRSPPELLSLKEKNPEQNLAEKLLDDFCAAKLPEFTEPQRFNVSIAVKSFFKWNYRSLEKASGIVTLEKVKPYNALTKEGLRKLYNHALNPRDRALIPFVTCTGIAKETLSNVLWGHLEDHWEDKDLPCLNIGPELLKGHGKGKYQGVRQVTFLTPEAKTSLLVYKEWIEDKLGRAVTAKDHIWLETYLPCKPLRYPMFHHAIRRLSRKTGVPFSLHDGRRWVNTALEGISISSNWARKVRGRKVRGEEAPYSQPAIEQLRTKYREAVPALEFTSETSRAVEDRLKAVEEVTGKLARHEPLEKEDYEKIDRFSIKLFRKPIYGKDEPSEDERKQIEKKDAEADACADGHCPEFSQIPEAQLLAHLKDGWQIIKELSNGEVIVKRVQ